jgi:jouberin
MNHWHLQQQRKKTRGAKSKSKPQHDDMGQTTGDEVDADTSNASALPPAKPRRKKKAVHKADTDEEHIADEPATMLATAAADNDRILQVTIHRTDKLKADFYIAHPLIRVHIIDLDTGACLKKQQKDRRVSSFFETENKNVDFILPIMTLPFDFKEHQSTLPIWEENIVFNENFDYLCQKSLNVMLFFEVMDFVSMKTANKYSDGDRQDGGWHHIAWAFLKLIGANGKPNIEKKVRLQLYNPPNRHTASRDGQPQVVSWWKSTAGQRIPYPSTLYVTVKPITGPMPVDPAQRSMCATQQEQSPQGYEQLPTSTGRRRSPLDGQTYREPSLWSRCQASNVKFQTIQHSALVLVERAASSYASHAMERV